MPSALSTTSRRRGFARTNSGSRSTQLPNLTLWHELAIKRGTPIDQDNFITKVPDPIEFIVSDRYLNRPNLYPRQATFLKVIFLRDDMFTQFDYEVIGEWEEKFRQTGNEGISPGVLDRIKTNQEAGRRWFREVLGVIGRRGSKGYMGGLAGSYVTWCYMQQPGGPQDYYGIDRDKRLTGIVFAGKKEQARDNLWRDWFNVITGGPCFGPFISRPQAERLTLWTPMDILQDRRRTVDMENDTASIEIIPAPSTTLAARGPASFTLMFDEQAHVVSSTAAADAEAVYDAATPALDQFGVDGFIYAPSSPWRKTGKFYENWQLSIEMDTGESGAEVPAYPERLMLQLPSWGIYEDWERADMLPLRPPPTKTEDVKEIVKRRRTVDGKRRVVTEEVVVGTREVIDRKAKIQNFKPLKNAIQVYDDQMRRLQRANPDTFAVERLCLDPSTRILMADLTWRRLDDVEPGDLVVATDEYGALGTERKMRTAVVEAKADSIDAPYRVTFDDGTSVVCSGRHRWLSSSAGSRSNFRWRSIEPQGTMGPRSVMKVGDTIRALVEPWEEDDSRETGWLAGLYDGEGCVVSRNRFRTEFRIDLAQNRGLVLDRALAQLVSLGFEPKNASHESRTCQCYKVVGLSDCLRLLGQVRPIRLLQNGNPTMWEGRAFGHERGWRFVKTITSIQPLPEQRLVDLQTSTKTFIAEGLVSHNSHWAESIDAYLNATMVDRMFLPWEGNNSRLSVRGVLDRTYMAHGDPATSNKRFGWALGHRVWVPDLDEEGKPTSEGWFHAVIDVIRCWEPADYEDHILDYDVVMEVIKDDVKVFIPENVSFDQFNVPATIGTLRKWIRTQPFPKAVHVNEVTRTAPLNWRHSELFKSALNMGLVHAPMYQPDGDVNYASDQGSLELKFLEEKNGKVNHPDTGPIQSKDIADAIMEVTVDLIGKQMATFLGYELASVGLTGMAPQGTDPYRNQKSPQQRLGEVTGARGDGQGAGQGMAARGLNRGGLRRR